MADAKKFTFTSVTGETLDARLWLPEIEPKAVVQLVHGMAEHIDRYDATAKALNAAGYAVVGHNHLGHGAGASLHGFFGEKDGWQHLIDDVHTLRTETEKQFPGKPYILLGHSMGSFVSRCYLMEHCDGLAATVLSGTGYFPPAIVKLGLTVSGVQRAFGLGRKPGHLLNMMSSAGNNKMYADVRTPFDWLTRDRQVVDAYIADPLCGFPFTVDGYRDMFSGMDRMNRLERLSAMNADMPVLFMSGTGDPVGGAGKGVETVARQFTDAGMKHVTVRLYPEGRHEMLNELNREQVWSELITWLDHALNGENK